MDGETPITDLANRAPVVQLSDDVSGHGAGGMKPGKAVAIED